MLKIYGKATKQSVVKKATSMISTSVALRFSSGAPKTTTAIRARPIKKTLPKRFQFISAVSVTV